MSLSSSVYPIRVRAGLWLAGVLLMTGLVHAQMDVRQASGVPLPAADLPAGTVSVRVVRDSFANNLAGETVTFTVDGATRTLTTDASGRAQVAGLKPGSRVKASVVVGTERIDSQEVTIEATGIRFVLVASSPAGTGPAGTGAGPAASAPAVAGSVTLGPDSRIVIDFADERLNVYYVAQIINAAATPVDLGGPLVFELPSSARGATVMEGSSPNAKASGAHVTVTGPFAPGKTEVSIAYELPYSGSSARLEQVWPADAQAFTIFALKTGGMTIDSPQITNKQDSTQQGQAIVMGLTPALKKGQVFALTVTGLPSHAVWPRNVAFGLAGTITLLGLWAAFGPASRRRA